MKKKNKTKLITYVIKGFSHKQTKQNKIIIIIIIRRWKYYNFSLFLIQENIMEK